jgi:hypothetical protein
LRTTAPPTARLTMNPARGGSADPSWTSRYPVSRARPARRPPRTAAVKSARRRIRAAAGSKGDLPFLRRGGADQALRRARPLRRRAARTARPALVRMRSRKPCVLARRRLFGWNVRLLTGTPGTVLGFWGPARAISAHAGSTTVRVAGSVHVTRTAGHGQTSGGRLGPAEHPVSRTTPAGAPRLWTTLRLGKPTRGTPQRP